MGEQALTCLDAAVLFSQAREQAQLSESKWHQLARYINGVSGKIDAKVSSAKNGFARLGRSAQQVPNAEKEFARAKRLCHIVVGAQFEAADSVQLIAACGQENDRQF